MKRLFFTVTLAACLTGLSSFASGKNYPDALQSFYKTFQKAENVNWTQVDDMLRIGFTINGRQQFAYYSNEDLVVVATEIQTEELPETLKIQLPQYEGVVSQVYELKKNKKIEYCVVIDSPSKHLVLKGKNKWSVYLVEKK